MALEVDSARLEVQSWEPTKPEQTLVRAQVNSLATPLPMSRLGLATPEPVSLPLEEPSHDEPIEGRSQSLGVHKSTGQVRCGQVGFYVRRSGANAARSPSISSTDRDSSDAMARKFHPQRGCH